MKLSGGSVLHARKDIGWTVFHARAVLVRTIPACEAREATDPAPYERAVTAAVASIKGTYTGEVALSKQRALHSFLMTTSGAGGPVTIGTQVRMSHVDAGEGPTTLSYDTGAAIGGVVARVGQRMLVRIAQKKAGEFATVADVLTRRVFGVAASAAAGVRASVEPGAFIAPPKASRTASFSEAGLVRGLVAGTEVAVDGMLVDDPIGRQG